MMKKYEFTGETKTVPLLFENVTLHRIQAITSFENVVAGELGGWIEKEENLSQGGNAWVGGNAQVSG
ncbi:polymer-forming cytoskeletal protein, partial [Firmicutes bacterium AM10-47]